MNASSAIAVVETRLPYIDRRALSQAWFSALHLSARLSGAGAPSRGTPCRDLPAQRARSVSSFAAPAALPPRARPAAFRAGTAPRGVPQERVESRARAPKPSPPSRACARSYPSFQAALTIGLDGGRVALVVRRDGAMLHVVALCSARHVELVRRALAGASAALAAGGDSVRTAVRSAESRA